MEVYDMDIACIGAGCGRYGMYKHVARRCKRAFNKNILVEYAFTSFRSISRVLVLCTLVALLVTATLRALLCSGQLPLRFSIPRLHLLPLLDLPRFLRAHRPIRMSIFPLPRSQHPKNWAVVHKLLFVRVSGIGDLPSPHICSVDTAPLALEHPPRPLIPTSSICQGRQSSTAGFRRFDIAPGFALVYGIWYTPLVP